MGPPKPRWWLEKVETIILITRGKDPKIAYWALALIPEDNQCSKSHPEQLKWMCFVWWDPQRQNQVNLLLKSVGMRPSPAYHFFLAPGAIPYRFLKCGKMSKIYWSALYFRQIPKVTSKHWFSYCLSFSLQTTASLQLCRLWKIFGCNWGMYWSLFKPRLWCKRSKTCGCICPE